MDELKRFDKYQLLIAILSASSFALSTVFFIIMYFTAQIVVEEGELQKIIYNPTLQGIYSFFTFAYTKYTGAFKRLAMVLWSANSTPLSSVIDFTDWGKCRNIDKMARLTMCFLTRKAVLFVL